MERKKEHGYSQHGQIVFFKSRDTRKTQTAQPTLQNRSVGSSTAKSTLQNRSVGSSTAKSTLQNRSVGSSTAKSTLQNRSVGSLTAKSTLQNRSVGSSTVKSTLQNRSVGSSTAKSTLQNRSVGSSTAKPTLQNRSVGSSIIGVTTGWNMEVDLGKRLAFPDVVQTSLRPDIVLWSKTGKKLIVIELTVPLGTRFEETYQWKKAKYTEPLDLCKEKCWRTWLFPVEVGVRGFCSQSVCILMTAVGTSGRDRKRASQAVEWASSWLWLRREMSWKQSTSVQ